MINNNFTMELDKIKNKITDVATGILEANTLLLSALEDCKTEKFTEAKQHIKNIGSRTDSIDNDLIKVLALHSPEARDLRKVIAYLKITNELARASSNTRSFIKGFTDVCSDVDITMLKEYAVPMQKSTVNALKVSIEMIHCEDKDEVQELYNDVLIEENKTDDLYEIVERSLTQQVKDINTFEKFHKMLKALRKSEKIAARAISIANLLVYAKIGGNFSS